MAKTELMVLTATISLANVTGWTKSGVTPLGGGSNGIMSRVVPGGTEETTIPSTNMI